MGKMLGIEAAKANLRRDFRVLVKDAITRTALRHPPIPNLEEAAATAVEFFNAGAEAIESASGLEFGLRLGQTVISLRRVRDGKEEQIPEKQIVVQEQFPGGRARALSLLRFLISENRELTTYKLPAPPRQLSKGQLAAFHRRRMKLGLLDSYPALETITTPPEAWHWMLNFLLMANVSRREIERHATAKDGWWRTKGRKRKVGIEAQSRLAHYENQMDWAENQLRERANLIPTAGGMVPPRWPTYTRNGLAIPKKLKSIVYPAWVQSDQRLEGGMSPRKPRIAVDRKPMGRRKIPNLIDPRPQQKRADDAPIMDDNWGAENG